MVVLEGGGMLSSNGNQYLQPDYLSPLPTTLDAKKSPLALLAQTCSQIGADSPSSKPLISPLDKPKKNSSDGSRSSPASARDKTEKSASRSSPTETKLAFKPYETNVITKRSDESRPSSKSGNTDDERKPETPHRKTASPANSTSTPVPENGKTSPPSDRERKSSTPRGASPIIRSGLEMLQGTTKDTGLSAYKPLSGLPGSLSGSLSSLCCPPGLEHTNPAFRPPFPGGPFSHHHAAMLAASGYPGTTPGPYLSYARVKTPAGGEALVPVCKDPYCTGCQFSMHNQQLLMSGAAAAAAASGPCPSGCTQCDHQKYNLAMAMSLVPPGAVHPSSLAYPQLGRPLICNWIAGDTYCGKRCVTSEELLQHLRTHTNGADAAAAVAATTTAASSLMNAHSLFSTSALHRYPNPPLSPLSAARYHPYAKPGVPGTLAASPYSAFNPTTLGQYYSPYSIYGQRLGAAVHP
ncbi:zinc finger protein Noc [Atheta coriaria]|uniref:zinc finger protein Noc n=1 Tax=Dalotia coriaria TaxID=877792 RepID=UPI0031F34428